MDTVFDYFLFYVLPFYNKTMCSFLFHILLRETRIASEDVTAGLDTRFNVNVNVDLYSA